jgi:pimeloyl-ACP methyl ester carboxylesterase
MTEHVDYDEFSFFHENAREWGLSLDGPPAVSRDFVEVAPGRRLSALLWGPGPARIVFLHGGAQNAHTWDTVMLALGLPAVCIDLPTHGHSDTAAPVDPLLSPFAQEADDVARAIGHWAPGAELVVGMSRGGIITTALMRDHPALVARAMLVDITPGVNAERTKQITDFVNGPATFASFDDLLARTIEFNPTRSVSSLRRGILHNALRLPDGGWVWRHRRDDASVMEIPEGAVPAGIGTLWDAIARFAGPLMLVRGMREQSVVSDDDEAELLRRNPAAEVVRVQEAGHSIQGDAPLELAAIIGDFLGRPRDA